MRLLDTSSYKLTEFHGEKIPPYVILSHTWGEGEVLLHDIQNNTAESKHGYSKLIGCCQKAVEDGFQWVWIDTCCIDKSSSTELSEAINSMYQWYRDSTICYAYLEDVGDVLHTPGMSLRHFMESRWFTRGWTLQELIAPRIVEFYTAYWEEIGTKRSLIAQVEAVTGIPARILHGESVSTCNVAQRMSWASNRQTTRREDRAYSLMGLFQLNMPLLYGEGDKAFVRLQEQILRQEEDYTIFAWTLREDCLETTLTGCLASSPNQFAKMASKGVVQPSGRGGLRAFKNPLSLPGHTPEPYYNNDKCQVMRTKNYELFRKPGPGLSIGMPLKPPEFTARGVSISLLVRPAPDTWLSAMAWIYCEVDGRLVCVLLKPYESDPISIHARFSSPVLISVDKSLLSEFKVTDLFLPPSGFWDLYPELGWGGPAIPVSRVWLKLSLTPNGKVGAHIVSTYPSYGWKHKRFYFGSAPNDHGTVLIECTHNYTGIVTRFMVSCGIHEGNPWCSIQEVLGANEQDWEKTLEELRRPFNLDSVGSGYSFSTTLDRAAKISVKIKSMVVSAKIRRGPKDEKGTPQLTLQMTVGRMSDAGDWVQVYAQQHPVV
ncbi:HET domain-containing protein [Fusarium sp. LHS14.1]|nr:HET domain-containing protein [Fusarium sp. LHS14.1]